MRPYGYKPVQNQTALPGVTMHVWSSWYDALTWCRQNATEDIMVLTSDWDAHVSILKYNHWQSSFFYAGEYPTPHCEVCR